MSNQQVTVLVADDGREIREFVVNSILRPNGFIPLIARDGVEALDLAQKHQPDLILLDLQMPRMDGLQVLDALKAKGLDIPVILMTFHGSEEIAIEVYRKGVRDYVKKPYTPEEMLDAMNRALAEVRLRREKDALTERLLRANADLNRRLRELNALYQIGKSVTALVGMDKLLPRIVDAATQVIGAEQGKLQLLDGNQLVLRAVKLHNEEHAHAVYDYINDRIARQVAQKGELVAISAEEMNRHRTQDPSLPAAVICIPLKVKDRVVGVLSVENVSAGAPSFGPQDAPMVSALGDYAAIAIENARIYVALEEATTRENETLRSAFERYVAPSVVERILQTTEALTLGGRRREISVVFADVRGFTTFSEQASPEEVVNLMNEYFTLATDVIFSREGTLDKFMGDAVMAFFNAPEDQADHPYRAVDSALALQRAIVERNSRIGGQGLTFGIGVHLGEVVVGNIGTARAMNYTAIGDTVNVTKRLQERALPGQILISAEVYARLGNLVKVKSMGELSVKGRHQPIQVYELESLK
ncbi:MAG: response regulator [Chloroflexi bacterium]|nr:response regulator [Chloroflexota bacterium]